MECPSFFILGASLVNQPRFAAAYKAYHPAATSIWYSEITSDPEAMTINTDTLETYKRIQRSRRTESAPSLSPLPPTRSPPPVLSHAPPAQLLALATSASKAPISEGEAFLFAREVKDQSVLELRTTLKSLLGMARVLGRTIVLPESLCSGAASSRVQPVPPFGCAPRIPLPMQPWLESSWVVRPASFLKRADMPQEVRKSHVRVTLPDGMDGPEIIYALRHYKTTRLLEIDKASRELCARSPTRATQPAPPPDVPRLHACGMLV